MLKLINHPIILYQYFTKDLFKFFLFSLLFLIILIFFIDLIELFRRSSNKIGVNHLLKANFIDLAGMASLKIVGNIQKILPFATLIGSIACFNQWRKKNYYVISKASGVSLWKILSPILVCFFFVGLFSIIVLSPFSTLMNKKYENLETLFFGKVNVQELSFDTKGFWIKHISEKRNLIINANKIDEKTNTLFDLNIFEYDNAKIFKNKFTSQKLLLYNVQSIDENYKLTSLKNFSYSINFDSSQLSVATKKPEKIFLLDFPYYLIKMKSYGLNISKHLIYFFKLICQPFLIISMILLSASLMLRSNERKIEVGIVSLSLVVGFSLYFIGDFIFALGFLEKIPPLLAGFGPTLIGLFSGCYLISDIDEIKNVKNR